MRKRVFALLIVVSIISVCIAGRTEATPIRLDYQITDLGGGLYDYEFTLVLDDHDSSWAAGQGWTLVCFGDADSSPSPLTDFIGDTGDLPVGSWTYYTSCTGYHNGPVIGPDGDYWIPTAVGESLFWSGTSTAYLGQGELLFSTLDVTGGADWVDFVPANLVTNNVIPAPGAMLLVCIGFLGCRISGIIRRK